MAVEKVAGGTVKNTVGLANRVRNILQSVENLFNRELVERVFEDASIPNSKLVGTGVVPYTSYIALLSQTSTNAPTAIVLENSLGFTPTFAYVSTGIYTISGIFPDDLVYTNITLNLQIGLKFIRQTATNVITIRTYDNTDTLANDWLIDTPIEIRVYS